eukprot:g40381.t1
MRESSLAGSTRSRRRFPRLFSSKRKKSELWSRSQRNQIRERNQRSETSTCRMVATRRQETPHEMYRRVILRAEIPNPKDNTLAFVNGGEGVDTVLCDQDWESRRLFCLPDTYWVQNISSGLQRNLKWEGKDAVVMVRV